MQRHHRIPVREQSLRVGAFVDFDLISLLHIIENTTATAALATQSVQQTGAMIRFGPAFNAKVAMVS